MGRGSPLQNSLQQARKRWHPCLLEVVAAAEEQRQQLLGVVIQLLLLLRKRKKKRKFLLMNRDPMMTWDLDSSIKCIVVLPVNILMWFYGIAMSSKSTNKK